MTGSEFSEQVESLRSSAHPDSEYFAERMIELDGEGIKNIKNIDIGEQSLEM